jgi:hypothetical protein
MLFGGVRLVLLVSAGIAAACGGFAYASSSTSTPTVTTFFTVESLDALLDVGGFALTWAEGDLEFSNDPDSLVRAALGLSVVLSVTLLIVELWCGRVKVQAYLRLLTCVHLVVEDVFQVVVYALIAGTQASAGLGAWGSGFGCFQALLFSGQKLLSLHHSGPAEGIPPLTPQSSAELVQRLRAHLTSEVGITDRSGPNGAEAYARRLVESGYDSPTAFANVSIRELENQYQWLSGHARKVQIFRQQGP